MAEARVAFDNAPALALQRAGAEVDTNVKVPQLNLSQKGLVLYIPAPKYLFRMAKRFVLRNITKLKLAFVPAPLPLVALTIAGFTAAVVRANRETSWFRTGWLANMLWKWDSLFPWTSRLPTNIRVGYLALSTTAFCTYWIAAGQRFVLRRLLSYHGYLFEARGRPSLTTKVWGLLLKNVFVGRMSHHLNAFQPTLPTLGVPSLKKSLRRYLDSVQPLLSADELVAEERAAEEFRKTVGWKLQILAWFKWLTSTNYVSDLWLRVIYLAGRDSIFINSNWYGICYASFQPTTDQVARAAVLTHELVRVKRNLEQENFDPQIVAKIVPLCMKQYEYIFSTTRVPGAETDALVKYESHQSRHIVVFRKGAIYKLPVYSPKSQNILTPQQIKVALDGIMAATENLPSEPEDPSLMLPVLTTMDRTEWARVRLRHFANHDYNKLRLEVIESALFVLSLDENESPMAVTDWTEEGRRYFLGNGLNRWCDKSFNLVVLRNGKAGVHAEHSWGDAPTLAHIVEVICLRDETREFYNEDGSLKAEDPATTKNRAPVWPAEKLDFRVDADLKEVVLSARTTVKQRIEDLDLNISKSILYGRDWISKAGQCSPDAWVQMALQLAYFRDQGKFELTYESSMTRFFKEGRTETIRPVTAKSCAFVRAMDDPSVPADKKLALLRDACELHQTNTHLCMVGQGFDRHLFVLAVVAHYYGYSAPFLRNALRRKFTLSTSQVPTQQQCDPKEHKGKLPPATYESPNGGFGPVADDGYGVCYDMFRPSIYFNVSAKNAADNTSASRFVGRILRALVDMKALVPPEGR